MPLDKAGLDWKLLSHFERMPDFFSARYNRWWDPTTDKSWAAMGNRAVRFTWQTGWYSEVVEPKLRAEIFRRLVSRRPLFGLGLPERGGRVDLRGFALPKPGRSRQKVIRFGRYSGVAGSKPDIFSNVEWDGLDFTGSDFTGAMFEGARLENCAFDLGHCSRLGFWHSEVVDCSFVSTDLRQSVLGSLPEESPFPNRYSGCDFDGADLTNGVHSADQYKRCSFRCAKLDGLRFRGTLFENCVFAGQIHDVTFFPLVPGKGMEGLPSNRLQGCDFSRCSLSFVDFQGMDLSETLLPEGQEHIILRRGPDDLVRWSKGIDEGRRKQFQLYLERIIAGAGTPSVIAVSDLEVFTPGEVERLRRIANEP